MTIRSLPQSFDIKYEIDVFDQTRANAQPERFGRLKTLRKSVKEAYKAYSDAATPTVLGSIIEDLEGEDARHLLSNYPKLRSGVKKEIGATVLERSDTCCLCWYAQSGQLDHYLPKSQFPEFSVFTLNLVPVCGRCNVAKKENYLLSNGLPLFLHAYLDSLPLDERFLEAEIHIGKTVTAEFYVKETSKMDGHIFETLRSHFAFLKLSDLYGKLATEVMVEELEQLYWAHDEGGADAVKRSLSRAANGAIRNGIRNRWKPVLLMALAGNAEFCDLGFEVLGEREEEPYDCENF